MPDNAIYAILEQHLVSGSVSPGKEIGIRCDQFLTQDGTGTMVFMHMEAMARSRVKNRLAICYVDHNTLGVGPENAADHRYLRAACRKYKVHFSKPGNGIGHQVHLERFAMPGKLLLGADSHVTTQGGMGMLAIGTGGLELAVALSGAPHYFTCPEVIKVNLKGKLRPWCSAKDTILHIIGLLSERSNVGTALEYAGPGVANLSVPQRATMANMGAELGVTTSLFPSDEQTKSFLSAQGRPRDYRKVSAPAKSVYADEIEVDLRKIVPMVALPHSPYNVIPVREAGTIEVDQVAIGSCTNGGFSDLARVALTFRGKHVHPNMDVVVSPASRQTARALLERKYLAMLLDAGCRVKESVCGFCIGHGQAPAEGTISVRTVSRNYQGRCGTMDSKVYLVSPETAAATALTGKLTDPRDLKKPMPRVTAPKKYPTDDSMVVKPGPKVRDKAEISKAANMKAPPINKALPASLNTEVCLKLGDRISTDDILPAGRWLKYRSNIEEYAKHTFAGIDPTFASRARENLERDIFSLIVAGDSYGQGSSREHAAMCPMVLGVRVVLAKSYERIHMANLINHGIIPLTFMDPHEYDQINKDDYLELPWIARELRKSKTISLRNPDRGVEFKVSHQMTRRQINIVLDGGLHSYSINRNQR